MPGSPDWGHHQHHDGIWFGISSFHSSWRLQQSHSQPFSRSHRHWDKSQPSRLELVLAEGYQTQLLQPFLYACRCVQGSDAISSSFYFPFAV